MKTKVFSVISFLMISLFSSAQTTSFDSSPIFSIDLDKYLGKWYEIARLDHSFERGMDNVTAVYTMRDDGMIDVLNSGWKNGKFKKAHGKARQPDPVNHPAHLEVSFFLSFYSDYNVLMLDPDYQVVLVGSKSPKYLWILSKTPEVNDQVLGEYLEEADLRGYDTGALIWVDQSKNLQ